MNTITKNFLLTPFNLLYKISPNIDLKILFRLKHGYKLDLNNPKTFNEKMQWIKLNDRNKLMPICCDKYLVRSFVEKQNCGNILNELYWEGFDPNKIPFDALPNQFVIKVTHGSTFNIICKDKSNLNYSETIQKCEKWLKQKFLPCYGEWFYGKAKPRIVVEKYLENETDEQLNDYKVLCFNGKAKIIKIDTDRFKDHKSYLYDLEWNKFKGIGWGCPTSDKEINKPENLECLIKYAERLSKPFTFARIDFYIVNGKIIFGEITFIPGAGFDKFPTYEFDLMLGNFLKLEGSINEK